MFAKQSDIGKGPVDFHDFAAVRIQMLGTVVTLISVYLDTGIGLKGGNLKKLADLAVLISAINGPWIAMGDWNMTPEDLRQSAWLLLVGGRFYSLRAPL